MSTTVYDISMSLDGYITAGNQTAEDPMGSDQSGSSGQVLHAWAGDHEQDAASVTWPDTRRPDTFGAIVCGRTTYETSLPWWGPDGPSGSLRLPLVVVAHGEVAEPPPDGVYSFAKGAEEALDRARELAGDRAVTVMGGGILAGSLLRAGLLDEIKIHLVPILLGAGTRLFDEIGSAHVHLEPVDVERREKATHLRYRVIAHSGPDAA